MNYDLLRTWLKLPPGPWPPTDRELVGILTDGPLEASAVELKAIERMDELRPHQLRHPELVTEGMNRLAQALIALTANAAPVAPVVKKPKKVERERTPVEIRKPVGEVKLDFDGSQRASSSPSISSPTVAIPTILEAEVVGEAVSFVDVIPESFAVQADEPTVPPLDEPIVIPEPPPGTVVPPSPRRNGYRELVEIRRVHDAWLKFRPLLGDPGERLLTPAKIAAYLDAIAELRTALQTTYDRKWPFPDLAGDMVMSVVCHPIPLSLLRDLVLSQRRVLARDWAVADADLAAKQQRIRGAMLRTKKRNPAKKNLRMIGTLLSRNPEWVLILIVVLALVVGYWRS